MPIGRNNKMKNFGIRYDYYGAGWIPTATTLIQYMKKDERVGDYGYNTHQFVPKEYAIEKE